MLKLCIIFAKQYHPTQSVGLNLVICYILCEFCQKYYSLLAEMENITFHLLLSFAFFSYTFPNFISYVSFESNIIQSNSFVDKIIHISLHMS